MRKQLQMQQDGINNMTIFEWLKNRENFKKHGRNPKSKKFKKILEMDIGMRKLMSIFYCMKIWILKL